MRWAQIAVVILLLTLLGHALRQALAAGCYWVLAVEAAVVLLAVWWLGDDRDRQLISAAYRRLCGFRR